MEATGRSDKRPGPLEQWPLRSQPGKDKAHLAPLGPCQLADELMMALQRLRVNSGRKPGGPCPA